MVKVGMLVEGLGWVVVEGGMVREVGRVILVLVEGKKIWMKVGAMTMGMEACPLRSSFSRGS